MKNLSADNKAPRSGGKSVKRRDMLKGLAGLPLMSVPGGRFLSTLSQSTGLHTEAQEVRGLLPSGKLGKLNISRMIMGCNQMGGWAHARDLIYASDLFKAYNTEEKIIETFRIGETAGINTTFIVNDFFPVFHRYRKEFNAKMQTVCQTYLSRQADPLGDIDKAIDNGADTMYIQGGEGDRYIREGKIATVAKAIGHIKKRGLPAGMGAHSLEVPRACEKAGIPVDYYVKTFHHDKYWSAHPMEQRVEFSVIDSQDSVDHDKIHDNMFDLFPDKTIEFMKDCNKPWIAFKVLAAGAIRPGDGFRYAFENGADFICVGMFDFQVIENVNTAIKVLSGLGKRERKWFS